MPSFHLNDRGEPGLCKAEPGNCPFGGEHFPSAKKAREGFELQMRNPSELETPEDASYNAREALIDYTPQAALTKFQQEIQGREFALSTAHSGEPGFILEELYGKDPTDGKPGADLGLVELKTLSRGHRSHTMTLAQLPSGDNIARLRQDYTGPNFQHNIQANKWRVVGKHSYKLSVDREAGKLRLLIGDENQKLVSSEDFDWELSDIDKKVDEKLQHIAVAIYDRTGDKAKPAVKFSEMKLGGFTRESMLERLESGQVALNVRITPKIRRAVLVSSLNNFAH